jgi:hypothetical protein
MNRGVGKYLVLFLVVLSPITLYLSHTASAVPRGSEDALTSHELFYNSSLLNGTMPFPGSVDIRFSPDRSELVSTTVGSSPDETKGPSTKVIASSESGLTIHTSCATTSDPSGLEDKVHSDVETAFQSNGIEFLGVPKHENDSYAKTLEIPVMTKLQILGIVGRLNLKFGNEKQKEKLKSVMGSFRGGLIVDYSGFCLWVKGSRTTVNEAKKLQESPGNGGLSENEIRIIEMFDKSLKEMSCDGRNKEFLPYFNVKHNIGVCKFHYDIWQISKPAKGEEDLAASLEQAKKDLLLVIDGVDKLSSLFIRGDISLWVASVTNLIEKINVHTRVECGSNPMDRLPCGLRGGLRHLGNQLSDWNNGTDPNRTNDIGYSNGRIKVLNRLLKTWNDDYKKYSQITWRE